MILSTSKTFKDYEAMIIVNWRDGNDYDIESVIIQGKNGMIDVTDMFTSDEIIEEIFGAIDWQMIYNQNHT
jgi:predicted dehydrogenase